MRNSKPAYRGATSTADVAQEGTLITKISIRHCSIRLSVAICIGGVKRGITREDPAAGSTTVGQQENTDEMKGRERIQEGKDDCYLKY